MPNGPERRAGAALAKAGVLCFLGIGPAQAQIAAIVSLDSQARDRGYSLSRGYPVAGAALAYDHPSGLYGNVALSSVIGPNGPHLLGGKANIGYARRISPDVSLDIGAVRVDYSRYSSAERSTHYSELYLGAATARSAARISFSPDYYRPDTPALYLEAERTFRLPHALLLSGHAGSLVFLGARPEFASRWNYDWRVALSRRWNAVELHAALSGGGPGDGYYRGAVRDRTAFVVGASHAF